MLFYKSPKNWENYTHAQTVCTRPLLGGGGRGLGTRLESELLATFLLDAYEKRASYRGTADLELYSYQDSSVATSHYQREKPKMIHTTSKNRRNAKSRSCVPHKHLPRYKLSVWNFLNPFSNSGALFSTSLMLTFSDNSFYNVWPHGTLQPSTFGVN